MKDIVIEEGKQVATSNFEYDNYPYLSLGNIEADTGKILPYKTCKDSQIRGSSVLFGCNNVLYSKLRPYLNKIVVPSFEGCATTELVILKPKTEIVDKLYLAIFLRSPQVVNGAIAKAIPTTEQRAKIFKRDRYAYQVTSYAKLYDTLGKQTPLALKNRNRFQQLVETQDIRTIIGKESIKSVLKNKPAVDELALQRLESIAKLKTKISD